MIGVICDDTREVFGTVAAELRRRGNQVVFFDPGQHVPPPTIEDLSLLLNNEVDPASFRAVRYAERNDVPTWNGYTTLMLGARLIGLTALETVGFRVPEVSFQKPDDDYVAKSLFDWRFEDDPELNGEGAFYQNAIPARPVDHKYYAVDTGRKRTVKVVRAASKLYGQKDCLDVRDPDPSLALRVRHLMNLTGARAVGVDIVESEDGPYAVDVNPAMSFQETGMENEIVESVLDCLRLTA